MTVLIGFSVKGNTRFLSHTEMGAMFQRACTRAGIRMRYTEGFNPHPKMSLPLPRAVGVESDCDLLYLGIVDDSDLLDPEQFKSTLQEQMPEGVEIFNVRPWTPVNVPQPLSAKYVINVRKEFVNVAVEKRTEQIQAAETIEIERCEPKLKKVKRLNVRPFLESVKMDGHNVIVDCKVGTGGSIRIDEILALLGLDGDMLASPVRRTYIQWQNV